MNERGLDNKWGVPVPITPPTQTRATAEKEFLTLNAEIELKRLELRRLHILEKKLIDEIKALEPQAKAAQDKAVELP